MTLGNLLEQTARRIPETPAAICGSAAVSYRDLNDTTTQLAGWLLDQGLQAGDRVAIHWANSIETVQLLFACFKAGLIAVPINTRLKAPEVGYILQDSEASLYFVEPDLAGVGEGAVTASGRNRPTYTALPRLESTSQAVLADVDPSQACTLLYTSGTTARPKGVVHTHTTLFHTARLMLSMIGDAGPVSMTVTQLAHISGLACILILSVLDGKSVVLIRAFDPRLLMDAIERYQVTYTGVLPAMLSLMADEQVRQPRDLRSLRALISGGDTVPVSLQERILNLFGLPVLELIGMTESSPMAWNTRTDLRVGSVGKPRADVETKITSLDGEEAKEGELAVRSPANFAGYWRDPEATTAVLRDGWLYTGDLVREDDKGYLWFAGRRKQIIIRGGSNIAPQEVEEALYSHPGVAQAGVIGVPDPLLGQKVAAFVTLREGQPVSEEDLREFARVRLADYKVPETIRFLPDLPKGLTGKIDRRALSEFASLEADAALDVMKAGI